MYTYIYLCDAALSGFVGYFFIVEYLLLGEYLALWASGSNPADVRM